MTVDSATKPILPSIDTPHCDLRPTPGTAAMQPTKRSGRAACPGVASHLTVLWPRCTTSIAQIRTNLNSFLCLRAARLPSPWIHPGAFRRELVNERVTVSTSYRYTYFFCISKSSEIPFSASVTRLSIVERLKTLPSPVPCTSMRLCSEVITTLKSTSACESSS